MHGTLYIFVHSQEQLESEDYGQHLMGVEDLRQKHTLIEQDIAVHGDRVKALEAMSEKFMEPMEDGELKPV